MHLIRNEAVLPRDVQAYMRIHPIVPSILSTLDNVVAERSADPTSVVAKRCSSMAADLRPTFVALKLRKEPLEGDDTITVGVAANVCGVHACVHEFPIPTGMWNPAATDIFGPDGMTMDDLSLVSAAAQDFHKDLRTIIECEVLRACCKACNVSPTNFLLPRGQRSTDIRLWTAIATNDKLIVGVLAPNDRSYAAQVEFLRAAEVSIVEKFKESQPSAVVEDKITLESLEVAFPIFRDATTAPPPQDDDEPAGPSPPAVIAIAISPASQPPADGSDDEGKEFSKENQQEQEEQKKQALLDGLGTVDADAVIFTDHAIANAPCQILPALRLVTPCIGDYRVLDARDAGAETTWPIAEVILHARPFAVLLAANAADIASRMNVLANGEEGRPTST
eukprot:GEMP01036594.1.p1 GENE.GEMP01036594.1~~GEMP01036594.1.p1  ORF type:complete len:393 (+),score=107.24 GEMP01036594.1:118-1296(+)